MDDDRQTPWEEIGGKVPAAGEPRLTLLKGGLSDAPRQTPEPPRSATEVEFITALTPCLQLCAPVGMSEQDRQTWFDAAYLALYHLPAAELYAAAREAMKTADHPSKIVPAIIRAAEGDRKDRYQPLTNPITPPSHRIEQQADPAERAKVAQTMGQLLKRMQANTPTLDTVLGKPA